MRLQTDICKDYFARNPKILERLNEVERMMGTEFNLECANSQYDTFDYTNKPIKFSWWIRFGSADMPVGLLNHCIDYPENNGINFSFVTWVDDEFLRLCEPLREKLEEISNRSLVGEIELDSETIYPLYPLYNGDNLLLMTEETIVEIKQTLEELKQAEKIEQVSQNLKVKDLVTSYPDFLGDYDVICNTSYVTQFADVYRVLAVTMVGIYTDIICTPNYQYVMLGNESYSETVKRMELHSEMRQVERVLSVA